MVIYIIFTTTAPFSCNVMGSNRRQIWHYYNISEIFCKYNMVEIHGLLIFLRLLLFGMVLNFYNYQGEAWMTNNSYGNNWREIQILNDTMNVVYDEFVINMSNVSLLINGDTICIEYYYR